MQPRDWPTQPWNGTTGKEKILHVTFEMVVFALSSGKRGHPPPCNPAAPPKMPNAAICLPNILLLNASKRFSELTFGGVVPTYVLPPASC